MPECYNKFIPIFIVKKIDCLCLCNKLRRKRAIDGGRKVTGRKVTGRKVAGRKVIGRKVAGRKVVGRKVAGRKVVGRKVTGRKMIRKNGQYEIFQAAL